MSKREEYKKLYYNLFEDKNVIFKSFLSKKRNEASYSIERR